VCRAGCTPECGERVFRTAVIAVLGLILFLVIPSIIFAQIEPWTYGEAFYFSFITLATIGFGDLLPSYNNVPWMTEDYRNWYRLAIAFWILILSAWFAGVLVSIQTSILSKALSTEEKFIKRTHGMSNMQSNMQLGLGNDPKAHHDVIQYPPTQYSHDVTLQYTGSRSPSSESCDDMAHGVVTRLAI